MEMLVNIILGWFSFFISLIISTICLVFAWNGVMPDLFGLKALTFTQAFCLAWVMSALVKPYVLYKIDAKGTK